jgi:Ser/Thr protein kinase RdoA (MazF antagonist)
MWSEFTDFRPELLADLGHKLALLDKALASFSHPGLERPLLWNMKSSLSVLEAYTPLLASDQQRSLVSHFERGYRERVLPLQNDLRRSVIHNDANRGNVLVDASGRQVIGIIDFGDMVNFWLVVEPAIAATYAMLDQADPLLAAQTLLRGYHQTLPLTETEISLVFDLVCMRLCISVCICAHQQKLEPGNEYLVIDLEETWALLDKLQGIAYSEARDGMLAACRQD